MPAKIALDIDGVLANFTDAYSKILTKITGQEYPPASDTFPPTWYWDRASGVTKDQESVAWGQIIKSPTFWSSLAPLPGAKEVARLVNKMSRAGHEVFFITNRPGHAPKFQTEKWLYDLGVNYPTVIVAADKLPIIKALKLEFFIDDKAETIIDVANAGGVEFTYLRVAPYNREFTYPSNVREAPNVLTAINEVYGQ